MGTTLRQVDDPEDIKTLELDRSGLPPGHYRGVGFDRRQVFDIDIRRIVTEYRAQILEDENGQRFAAPFPEHVAKAVQYGNGVKAQAVYLSQFQLIPYQRVQDYFQDQVGLPISTGSVFKALCEIQWVIKFSLPTEEVNHIDEIINIAITSGPPFSQLNLAIDAFKNAVGNE